MLKCTRTQCENQKMSRGYYSQTPLQGREVERGGKMGEGKGDWGRRHPLCFFQIRALVVKCSLGDFSVYVLVPVLDLRNGLELSMSFSLIGRGAQAHSFSCFKFHNIPSHAHTKSKYVRPDANWITWFQSDITKLPTGNTNFEVQQHGGTVVRILFDARVTGKIKDGRH